VNIDFPSHPMVILGLILAALFSYYRFFPGARAKTLFLLAVSAFFYSLVAWRSLPVLLGLSLATFYGARKKWFAAAILLNLGFLAFFKFWHLDVAHLSAKMQVFPLGLDNYVLGVGFTGEISPARWVVPMGISFFVFKHIGYLLDVRAGRYPASSDALGFMSFSAYFPQITAGPISSYGDTAAQFAALPERLGSRQATTALVYLCYGVAKKVLIADQIGASLDSATVALGGHAGLLPTWYMAVAYAMQLYFDFSGYTDMVLGISALFGITLPENFNNPFLAKDPRDFWERWHISLSSWFRYYVFFPLSRSLLKRWGFSRSTLANYVANLVTMLLVALWHGSRAGYLLWGLYYGSLLNLTVWYKRTGRKLPGWLGRPLFIVGMLLGGALFMSPSLAMHTHGWQLAPMLAGMIGRYGLGTAAHVKSLCLGNATLPLVIGIVLALSGIGEAAHVIGSGRGQARWQLAGWGMVAALSLLFMHQNRIDFFYVHF
jgi:alginate O-acetyltransferase complex protein AlgI